MKNYRQLADDAWPEIRRRARQRRIKNRLKFSSLILAPIALAIASFKVFHDNSQKSQQPLASTPTTDDIVVIRIPSRSPSLAEVLTSDDQTLDVLSDLGPIIINHPDGTRELIITRPHHITPPTYPTN